MLPTKTIRALTSASLTLAGVLAIGGPAGASEVPAGFRPYAPDSVWNQPLRADAPLSPDSGRYMAFFRRQVAQNGSWFNSASCGTPVYWAASDTPRITVALNHPSYMDPGLIRAWTSVPMPADAVPADCTDKNLSVLQRQPNGTVDQWEFFGAVKAADGSWSANWGGATQDIEHDRGIASPLSWSDPSAPYAARRSKFSWNVTASSISTMAGIVTLNDLRVGRIDHALSMAITGAAKDRWFWPAQRSDGGITDPDAVPEGARLRIDPSVDLSGRNMVPLVRMLAEAAQRYGITVRDTTGNVNAFIAEQPQAGTTNPVGGLMGGKTTGNALKDFPWDALQVLDAPMCSGYSRECVLTDRARIAVDELGSDLRLDTSGSDLNHPVSDVRWDLDGDGTYETDGGTDRVRTVARTAVGDSVGVRLSTRAGVSVTTTAAIPRAAAATPPVSDPTGSEPPPATTTPPTATTTSPSAETPASSSASAPVAAGASPADGGLTRLLGNFASAILGSNVAPAAGAANTAPAASRARVDGAKLIGFVARRRGTLRVTVSCGPGTAPCTGVMRVRIAPQKGPLRAVATKSYAVAGGKTDVIDVRLPASGVSAVGSGRRAQHLQVERRRAGVRGRVDVDLRVRR